MSAPYYIADAQPDVLEYVKACLAGEPPEYISDDLAQRVQKFAESAEAVMDVTLDVLRSGGDVPVDGVDINGTFVGGRGGESFSNRLSDYFIRQHHSPEEGIGAGFVAEHVDGRMTARMVISDVSGVADDFPEPDVNSGDGYYDPETGYGYMQASVSSKDVEDEYIPVEILSYVPELKELYLQSLATIERDFDVLEQSQGDLSLVDDRMVVLFVMDLKQLSVWLAEEADGKLDASDFKRIIFDHLQYEHDSYQNSLHYIEMHAELLKLNEDNFPNLQDPVSSRDLDWDSAEQMFAAARSVEPKRLSLDFDKQASGVDDSAPAQQHDFAIKPVV